VGCIVALGSPQDAAAPVRRAAVDDDGRPGETPAFKKWRKHLPRACASLACPRPEESDGKKRCGACNSVYYCDAACAQAAYPDHRWICPLLRRP